MCLTTQAQTFVGDFLYKGTYQYIKLEKKENEWLFSIPYEEVSTKYSINTDPLKSEAWEIQRGFEKWTFKTSHDDHILAGTLTTPNNRQEIILRKQNSALPNDLQQNYIGVYEDSEGRKVIVYQRFDYLQIMSPYSEESMSLKPIGEHEFWSVSGESSKFSGLENDLFQTLHISSRSGNHVLERTPGFSVTELWIPVGSDSIFAKLYLPNTSKKAPACLILPGGGAIGHENSEYEARFFAAYGVVSLIFDKPGLGKSKGPGDFRRQNFEERNEGYKELYRYLLKHPKVDPSKSGIHGSSGGARLALMMGIDLQDSVSFINAVAAPMSTREDQQLFAMEIYLRNLGVSENELIAIKNIWVDYYSGIKSGKIPQDVFVRAAKFREKNQRLYLPSDSETLPSSTSKSDLENSRASDQINEIKCPIFFQWGENDQRVNYRTGLFKLNAKKEKQLNFSVTLYKRGNHSFMTPEYEICPGYTDDKIKWLKMIGIL